MTVTLLQGDCRDVLPTLPADSVHCVVTSPPYLGLRDYGTGTWDGGDPACDHKRTQQRPREFQCGRNDGTGLRSCQSWTERDGTTYGAVCSKCGARRIDRQIGLEATPDQWLATMVAVFREVRRILRPDGVCWVNVGDSYNNFRSQMGPGQAVHGRDDLRGKIAPKDGRRGSAGYKEKDLLMMPARLALALQADGWWLRSMLPWLKRSAMPESVRDRPASAVEYVFLLTKSPRYFFDAEAVKRSSNTNDPRRPYTSQGAKDMDGRAEWKSGQRRDGDDFSARNMRNSDLFYDSLEMQPEPAADRAHVWDERRARAEMLGGPRRVGQYGDRIIPREPSEPLGLICDAAGAPLALDVNPQAFTGSHFAVFPEKLVEPLIRAGTSERGCCAACGAPWVRVTEKRDTGRTQKMADGWDTGEGGHGTVHRNGREVGAAGVPVMSSITTGWAAGCACDAAVVPCRVLDPFCGAGTVALVCDRLQRDAIGIELSAPYTAMATARVADDAPLFAWADAQP